MPVTATRHIRKMRGGAQGHLVAAADGAIYIVKAVNNPQGRRILVNEWIAAVFLKHLQIAAPGFALIEYTTGFLDEFPKLTMQLGTRFIPVEPGWHFGSRYPGDPMVTSVFDFIADDQVRQCANLWEFPAVLAFDKWTGNADARQSIYYRARLRAANSQYESTGLVTQMIDHGFVFEGPAWRFSDAPLQGLYPRPCVYEQVRGWDDFEPWLSRIVHFPEEVFDEAVKQIPPAWIDGEEDQLEAMLGKLLKRRARTPDLIGEIRRARPTLFPNWIR